MIRAWFGPTFRNMLAMIRKTNSSAIKQRTAITIIPRILGMAPLLPPHAIDRCGFHETLEGLDIHDATIFAHYHDFGAALHQRAVLASRADDVPRASLAVHQLPGPARPDP